MLAKSVAGQGTDMRKVTKNERNRTLAHVRHACTPQNEIEVDENLVIRDDVGLGSHLVYFRSIRPSNF